MTVPWPRLFSWGIVEGNKEFLLAAGGNSVTFSLLQFAPVCQFDDMRGEDTAATST